MGRSGRRGWRGSDARAKRGDSERDWAEMQPGDEGRRRSEGQCRAKRRGSRGEAAGGQPERGNKAREVGGCGSGMVRTRLLSRQGMYFSRGKAGGKRGAHLRGERWCNHPPHGAASAPLRNLGCGGSMWFLTVNSEIRVQCNCCRSSAKHTSRVGPAVTGGLVHSGREKKTENQWSGRVEPVFDSNLV